jgi:hypothetical protein
MKSILFLASFLIFIAYQPSGDTNTQESNQATPASVEETSAPEVISDAAIEASAETYTFTNTESKPIGEKAAPVSPENISETPDPKTDKASPQPEVQADPLPEAAPRAEETPESTPALPAKPDHTAWDALLKQYVSSNGTVDYAGFKAQKAKLQSYLDELAAHAPASDWSRNEKMAYWINAYNAFTVKLIVDNYPVSSIKDLHGGNPWDVKWIQLGDQTYSLNNIENDILRPKYKDARIHFAVNCAAKSCPPLHNRAWTAANLQSTLEQQTKKFINNTTYNTITANKVKVSRIFDWYGADFDNLIDYLNKYADTQIKSGAKVEFEEYDWGLNN